MGVVLVQERDQPYTNDIYTYDHHIIVDEPEPMGGQNLGAKPTELLLGALGSCMSITLRMYAEQKDIPVDHIRVHLKREVATKTSPPKILVLVELQGALNAGNIKRMNAIAKRCPVHKLITGELLVEHEVTVTS